MFTKKGPALQSNRPPTYSNLFTPAQLQLDEKYRYYICFIQLSWTESGKDLCDQKGSGHLSVNRYQLALARLQRMIAGAAKPNIRIRVRRSIIQIQCKCPGIGPIIPIPAALESF